MNTPTPFDTAFAVPHHPAASGGRSGRTRLGTARRSDHRNQSALIMRYGESIEPGLTVLMPRAVDVAIAKRQSEIDGLVRLERELAFFFDMQARYDAVPTVAASLNGRPKPFSSSIRIAARGLSKDARAAYERLKSMLFRRHIQLKAEHIAREIMWREEEVAYLRMAVNTFVSDDPTCAVISYELLPDQMKRAA